MEDMLSMDDMRAVFGVTDAFDIDREVIRVDLAKEDPGHVAQGSDGNLAIVVPLTTSVEAWLPVFKAELEKLGYVESEDDEE